MELTQNVQIARQARAIAQRVSQRDVRIVLRFILSQFDYEGIL